MVLTLSRRSRAPLAMLGSAFAFACTSNLETLLRNGEGIGSEDAGDDGPDDVADDSPTATGGRGGNPSVDPGDPRGGSDGGTAPPEGGSESGGAPPGPGGAGGEQNSGGMDPGSAGMGGSGGATPMGLCGNGAQEAGEACDDGGQSGACTARCQPFVCPANCLCEFFGGSAYAICMEDRLHSDAQTRCAAFDGTLAEVTTLEENRFLMARTLTAPPTHWIGGDDTATEGKWVFPSGANFWNGAANGVAVSPYPKLWRNAQPDNAGSENCVQFLAADSGAWNDVPCSTSLSYICEQRLAPGATCGNGSLEAGEACDGGGVSQACDADCTVPKCGDGVLNTQSGEACDDGNTFALDACGSDCKLSGLVAHWPLTDQNGTLYRDWVNGTNGEGPLDLDPMGFVLTANPTLTLDGVNDRLGIEGTPSPPQLDIFGPQIAFSVKVMLGTTSGGLRPIVARGPGEGDDLIFLALRDQAFEGGVVDPNVGQDRTELVSSDASAYLGDGKWHHLVVTLSNAKWSLYVDGIETDTFDNSQGLLNLSSVWNVGGFVNGSGNTFHGQLKDLRIYNRGLTAAEVATLRQLP